MNERQKRLYQFWQHVADQDAAALADYFTSEAQIRWHNTNELFTVPEFIRANCEYPGHWAGEVEQLEEHPDGCRAMTITKVWSVDEDIVCRVVSFFAFVEDKIACLDEFWGDVGPAPAWRQEMHIGKPLQEKESMV